MNNFHDTTSLQHNTTPHIKTFRYVEHAASLAMREWKRLPRLVSHIHLQLLQAAQQVRIALSSGQFVQQRAPR